MENKNEFKPYIPASKITPEITVTSVIVGVLLSVIFGAANAYLGLKVGMTVSASIPAAVIAMGVIRVILRKNSPLETNMVQTIGSAGESLAAGAIFTLPVLFMWANSGTAKMPSIIEITIISLIGGILGILFMIPLRNALIVQEHGVLPYPEGTACAEVVLAGEKGGQGAKTVFLGMGFAALTKFITGGLGVATETISHTFKGLGAKIGTSTSPAIISVGYICGPKISSILFGGGLLSWLVISPIITAFGDAAQTENMAQNIKYIGAGALIAGGLISLIKSIPLIVKTFSSAIGSLFKKRENDNLRTNRDMNMVVVIIGIIALIVAIWVIDIIPIPFIGAVMIVIFGFFFATVSSRMVGLVGSSNNPVSGMTIATVLITASLLKLLGFENIMVTTIAIAAIICIVTAIAGDTSQDLKTGFLLGATPKKQQIGEIIGVVASALAIGATLYLLSGATQGFTVGVEAPQANMLKTIVEGIVDGNLPWNLIFIGAAIAVIVEILRLPVLPFAIGMYLGVETTACIMIGGLIRLFIDKSKMSEKRRESAINNGTLFGSGMVAGEGIVGIVLAIFTVLGIDKKIQIFGDITQSSLYMILGFVLLAITIAVYFISCVAGTKKVDTDE
ncbi:MAG: oligopeptide transporter, OPT family [Ruminococcaceae bacterium]|nr:oligopeptide transporter, OPT family [Oscillospiraceae bacterium]